MSKINSFLWFAVWSYG